MTKRQKYAQYVGKWVTYCDPAGRTRSVKILSVDTHGESALCQYEVMYGLPDEELPTRNLDV